MAIWNRKRRRILLATLAIVPLGLLAALAFASPGTRLLAFFLGALVYQNTIAPWTIVKVPLPAGLGELKYFRRSDGMFQGGYNRRVEIRLGRGYRVISSDLVSNGGSTMVFLHWQPAGADGGPFLWLQDRAGVTVINLTARCLADDSKPTYAIPKRLQCGRAKLPVANDRRYFGRITQTGQGVKFLAEETWPPDIELARRFASERFPLPATGWDFQINLRPDPYDPHNRRYWITVNGPDSSRVTAWFKDDYPTSSGHTPATATLFWYPATDSGGPFIRAGRFEGYGYGASTLIDLAGPRAYRAFRTSGMSLNYGSEGRAVTGMTPIEDLWNGTAGFYPPADHFVLNPYGADKRQLPPLPEGVRDVTPQPIGTVDLKEMTFSPDVLAPVYLE